VFSHGYLSSNPTQTEKKPAKAKAPAAHKAAATIASQFRRQHLAADAVGTLASTLTFLSVHHILVLRFMPPHESKPLTDVKVCGAVGPTRSTSMASRTTLP
jgi:hypothetical protein